MIISELSMFFGWIARLLFSIAKIVLGLATVLIAVVLCTMFPLQIIALTVLTVVAWLAYSLFVIWS